MPLHIIIPLTAALVSFTFAGVVFLRWLRRRGAHLLLWCIGLVLFAAASGSEAYLGFVGFSEPVYRLWYLCGAVLVAAWLGQGTIYLLARRKTAHALMALLVIGSLYAAYRVFTAQVDPALLAAGAKGALELSGQAITTPGVRVLTPFFNLYGTFALVGGAGYSAWIFWRKRVLFNRTVGNVLIAAGALVPALGGTLTRFGIPNVLYISELLGAVLLFIGFLKATTPQEKPAAQPVRRQAADAKGQNAR